MTDETVLVLGAGASSPYGYPTGRQLLFELVVSLRESGHPVRNVLLQMEYPEEMIVSLADGLEGCGLGSVDAWLAGRPEWIELGKAAMAAVLIRKESEGRIPHTLETQGRWYETLWQRMKMGTAGETIDSLNLSIITFNYDRSLEYYLQGVMVNTFGLPEKAALGFVEQIPIVHVHGSLGFLPGSSEGSPTRPYHPRANLAQVRSTARSIQIVSDTTGDTDAYRKAHTLLDRAKRVVFLGFGYLTENMERLGIQRIQNVQHRFGTGMGLSRSLREKLESHFFTYAQGQRSGLGGTGEDVETFLHNSVALPE